MANHWAILVGINQYQAFQPLMYAQLDAIELRNFLVGELNWSPQRCVLMADGVSGGGSLVPTGEALMEQVSRCCETLTAEDTLWFFFSGYGAVADGEDYLLPIDAEDQQVAETGVAIAPLLRQLKTASVANVLVTLDINRSQSAVADQHLGTQSLELARRLDIPLVLSCHPEEFSHETLALRQGLFTAALIEALRFHGCFTVSQLVAYLTDRLPELSRHHLRPAQNPAAVVPEQYQFMLVTPPESIAQPVDAGGAEPRIAAEPAAEPTAESVAEADLFSTKAAEQTAAVPAAVTTATLPPVPGPAAPAPPPETPPPPLTPLPAEESPAEEEAEEEMLPAWQRWGLLIAGLLLVGVFVRNQGILTGREGEEAVVAPVPETEEPAPPEGNGLFAEGDSGTDLAPLEQAQAALAAERYGEALTWLEQVPLAARDEAYAELVAQAQTGASQAGTASQAALAEAQQQLQPVPVEAFVAAIEQAQQVPADDPYYPQAQEAMARWSQIILDLAEAEAAADNLETAIATANQVPAAQPLAEVAQQRAAYWQQQRVNRDVLKQAQESLVPDQAGTFRDAIVITQPISPEYPEYALAQERIAQWSQDILAIARTRAAQGDLEDAIAAAMLIPEATPAYEAAQEQIAEWQSQL